MYFDAFSGIAGDMVVGALLSLGASWAAVEDGVRSLEVAGLSIAQRPVNKGGVEAVKFDVEWPSGTLQHRHLPEILERLARAGLPQGVAQRARAAFEALAFAEARIHGISMEAVHLHEVGAEDSIADIVAASVAFEDLAPDQCMVGPIPTGSGWTLSAHGRIPIPAPATLELLRGFRTRAGGVSRELTTPTGAALLSAFHAQSVSEMPEGVVSGIGYGAGTMDLAHPNILRAVFLEMESDPTGGNQHVHA
nr:LarC family nickel insertion protein [Sulfobacillus harzensis]